MKKSTALLASLALAAMSTCASATSFLFTFSGDGGVNSASGTLNGTLISGTNYTATSGTINTFGPVAGFNQNNGGSLIANPAAPAASNSPSGYFTYDNTLLANQNPLLTSGGLLFSVGGQEVNIFYDAGTYTLYGQNGLSANGSFALTQVPDAPAVPEPATWAMMLMGFGMIGFAARNRRAKVRVTYA